MGWGQAMRSPVDWGGVPGFHPKWGGSPWVVLSREMNNLFIVLNELSKKEGEG